MGKTMRRMAWLLILISFVAVDFVSVGCGGSRSADKAKRMGGRKRLPDDEGQPAAAAAPPATAQPAAAPPAVAANTPAPNTPMVTPVANVPAAAVANQPPQKGAGPEVALPPLSQDLIQRMQRMNAPPEEGTNPPPPWTKATNSLQKIGKALQKFQAERGELPPFTPDGLSWRVAILPYMGYSELYEQFDRKSPWDSPRNVQLVGCIPPEYQAPERYDGKTNYLLVTTELKAGNPDQVLLVDAADSLATPWTAPHEFKYDRTEPAANLNGLRNGCVLLMLPDFQLRFCPKYAPAVMWRGLLEGNSPEAFAALRKIPLPTQQPPQPDSVIASLPAMTTSAAVAAAPMPGSTDRPGTGTPEVASPPNSFAALLPEPAKVVDRRLPVPSSADLRRAVVELREVYKQEYEAAQRADGRQAFLKKMIAESSRLQDDDTAYFATIDLVRKVALQIGDIPIVFSAIDNLDARYKLDGWEEKCLMLEQLNASPNAASAGVVGAEAGKILTAALQVDNYELALRALEIGRAAAKKLQAKSAMEELSGWRSEIEFAQQLLADAKAAVQQLGTDPNHPQANEALGKYVCLVKGKWDVGLPLLAKAEDVRFKVVATIDLESGKSAPNAAAIAEQWWTLGDSLKHPLRRNCHLRGIYWGEQAIPGLNNNLQRVKLEGKLTSAKKEYARFLAVPAPAAAANNE